MSDIDRMGRHHAEVARSIVDDVAVPPMAYHERSRRGRKRLRRITAGRGILVALAAGALTVLLLLPLGLFRPVPPADTPETATTGPIEPDVPSSPFAIHPFLTSGLDGGFEETTTMVEVSVVVLAPSTSAETIDLILRDLPGVRSIHTMGSDEVAAAASRFASKNDSEELAGDWIAYGLAPDSEDDPISEWESELLAVDNTFVTVVAERLDGPAESGWDGWEPVARLPVETARHAHWYWVDSGIVTVEETRTRFIGPDGSTTTLGIAPMYPSHAPTGSTPVVGFAHRHSLVLIDYIEATTWILDARTLTWNQADPKPTTGNNVGAWVLGAAVIEDELFVVDAAARIGDAASAAAALSLQDGSWRRIDAVPSPISVGGVTTDGDSLIVAGTRQDDTNSIIGDRNPLAYRHIQGSGWQALPNVPIDGQTASIGWTDPGVLLAWNFDLEFTYLEQWSTWQPTGVVPLASSGCMPESFTATNGIVGILCGQAAWFDAASLEWTNFWTANRETFDTTLTVAPDHVAALWHRAPGETLLLFYTLPPLRS